MRSSESVIIVAAVAVIVLSGSLLSNIDGVLRSLYGTPAPEASPGKVEISVPAVDSNGDGVVGKFGVEAVPGDGKTLTNIDNLFYFVDTQSSIQTAKSVAANFTGIDISEYNIIYEIDTGNERGSVVEGPSAGAALAVATIAALEGSELSSEVMITGSINEDGTIGKIGGLAAKMEAAKDVGAKVLLVPSGQGLRQSFAVDTECKEFLGSRVCRTDYRNEPTISNNGDGLIVKEVSDVSEALKYFVQ